MTPRLPWHDGEPFIAKLEQAAGLDANEMKLHGRAGEYAHARRRWHATGERCRIANQ